MKILSLTLFLAAVALVAVEAAPGSVGSHFLARMIRDNEEVLLQRRGDPDSQPCKDAIAKAMYVNTKLIAATQDNTHPAVKQVQEFQAALLHAYGNRNVATLGEINRTYEQVLKALGDDNGTDANRLRDAVEATMVEVRNVTPYCQKS
ncbi:hypothetical protein BGZ95_002243 [Linnemannia exigua]|uniref:Uncharacterized protein n=1 Tax=Linnemannia exigua TaxID=604196 RepID=A0AAD4H9K1_9FUNG|nr:hypothetical protein BGZ95_002243 [Linnemannia exigua]